MGWPTSDPLQAKCPPGRKPLVAVVPLPYYVSNTSYPMAQNLLDPVVFSCLVEGMAPHKVHLVMSEKTFQAFLSRVFSMGEPAGIAPQPAHNGIAIKYDPAMPLHGVKIVFQPPYIRSEVTVTLDL
jgi:hypothetical protein